MLYGWYGWHAWHAWHSWPDAWHTPSATVVCLCVFVTGSIQNGQAKQRSRLSSSDTFTQRQGPTCACLFHEDSDFTRRLICTHTLSACHNLFTLHLSSPGHLTPVPPSPPSSHLTATSSSVQAWTPSLSCWSQLEIPQHNRFWALPPNPQW